MAGPKHLWAGDWESESGRGDRTPELPRLTPPAGPSLPAPAAASPPRTRAPRTRARRVSAAAWWRKRRRGFARAALLIGLAALVVAGGAYALSSSLSDTGKAQLADQPAWLGIEMLVAPQGAEVSRVIPGSPADAAGLRPGDVITQIQGQPVAVPVNVVYVVEALSPGQRVEIHYLRGRQTYAANVTLAARPARASAP